MLELTPINFNVEGLDPHMINNGNIFNIRWLNNTDKEKDIQTITISATTRCLTVSISKYLGEYCTTQESYEGAPVYIQNSDYVYSPLYSGRRAYLYRTHCGWYISHELGMDYGSCVVFRNATATHNVPCQGWQYNEFYENLSLSSMWVSAHTITVAKDHLSCDSLAVEGVGDADGEYLQLPGKHAYGRQVFKQTREPFCILHVDVYGWSVKNNGHTVAFSQYASMCPADPLAGYEDGVIIKCNTHKDVMETKGCHQKKTRHIE